MKRILLPIVAGLLATPLLLAAADKAAAEALLADPAPDHRPKPKA